MRVGLAEDELLGCGDINTSYYEGGCSTWQELLLYYGLSKSQGDRFKDLLMPLMGTVTMAIIDNYHVILDNIIPESECVDEGWLARVEYLMGETIFHRMWTLSALYLARHPELPTPEFMTVD